MNNNSTLFINNKLNNSTNNKNDKKILMISDKSDFKEIYEEYDIHLILMKDEKINNYSKMFKVISGNKFEFNTDRGWCFIQCDKKTIFKHIRDILCSDIYRNYFGCEYYELYVYDSNKLDWMIIKDAMLDESVDKYLEKSKQKLIKYKINHYPNLFSSHLYGSLF